MKEGAPKPIKIEPFMPQIQKEPYSLVQEIGKTQAYQQRRFMKRMPQDGKGKR